MPKHFSAKWYIVTFVCYNIKCNICSRINHFHLAFSVIPVGNLFTYIHNATAAVTKAKKSDTGIHIQMPSSPK